MHEDAEGDGMAGDQTSRVREHDTKVLRASGVHKLAITDRDGNCLAFLLAWDRFCYDAETDTHVCVVAMGVCS